MSLAAVGINYEGGKIIEYAEKIELCIGFINAQIAMDAPFHDQIADESVRALGRSELNMDGYDEIKLTICLDFIISVIK